MTTRHLYYCSFLCFCWENKPCKYQSCWNLFLLPAEFLLRGRKKCDCMKTNIRTLAQSYQGKLSTCSAFLTRTFRKHITFSQKQLGFPLPLVVQNQPTLSDQLRYLSCWNSCVSGAILTMYWFLLFLCNYQHPSRYWHKASTRLLCGHKTS